jgi:hypothetical protein
MKTITALTAVVAMLAGISLASAAGMDTGGTPRGKGSGQFCITGSSGAKNCSFATVAACQKVAKSGETCTPNPNSATTGSKQ